MSQAPLTPADLLTLLQTWLTPYVKAKGGYVSLADNDLHLLELLAEKPVGFRVILHWTGDTADPDGGDEEGVADQHLEVIVTQPKGLMWKPGQELIKGHGTQQPLLVLVSQIRAKVREYGWPPGATYGTALYKGCEPVIDPTSFLPFRAKKLHFDLKCSLPIET